VANPHAGRGRAAEIVREVVTGLRRAGAAAEGVLTTSAGQATELSADAVMNGVVPVAVGGDGLLRAVAAGAARKAGTIGIVPAGRGNDFARMVGMTNNVKASIEVLLTARSRPVDLIAVTDARGQTDVAIGNVYLGFDSLSNVLANKTRFRLGRFGYKFAALQAAMTMCPISFHLQLDGVPNEFTGSGVAIANSGFYGAGVRLAPMADVHDGLLDVVLFESTTRRGIIAAMIAMTRGRHFERSDVRHQLARSIRVQAQPAMLSYSDGDPMCPTPFAATVLPGAIGLLRP